MRPTSAVAAVHRASLSLSQRCLLTASFLCAGLALVMTLTIMMARTSADTNPALTFGLGVCDNHVCFHGLVPGKASWVAAREHFNNQTFISIDEPGIEIRLFESSDSGKLGRVHISIPDDGSLSIGHVLLVYGRPCGVTVYPQEGRAVFRYFTARFTTRDHQSRISPSTPIWLIEIMTAPQNAAEAPCPAPQPGAAGVPMETVNTDWRGFGDIERLSIASEAEIAPPLYPAIGHQSPDQ